MSDKISDTKGFEDDIPDDGIVFKHSKHVSPIGEAYGSSPLMDRYGQDLQIRTRMCFCPNHLPTDCRFHGTDEKGWEECPFTEQAKVYKNIKGRWLWARNPLYGKSPNGEESVVTTELLAA